jgi:AraC family transcriptional regulator, regulatory protein of adaptative response / methylated-DNA-[protein]-cysteine methyltransferase
MQTTFTTPLGDMIGIAMESALLMLDFHDRRDMASGLLRFSAKPDRNQILDRTGEQLAEYFSGVRKSFDVPLLPPGTDFQQAAWTALRNIVYGTTISYTQQARTMNLSQKPRNAARAVAQANACNFISVIIPCHRVVGANGTLTGYASGIERKKWLIEHEARHAGAACQNQLSLRMATHDLQW